MTLTLLDLLSTWPSSRFYPEKAGPLKTLTSTSLLKLAGPTFTMSTRTLMKIKFWRNFIPNTRIDLSLIMLQITRKKRSPRYSLNFVVEDEKRKNNSIAAQKINALYGHPELVELREEIRQSPAAQTLNVAQMRRLPCQHQKAHRFNLSSTP